MANIRVIGYSHLQQPMGFDMDLLSMLLEFYLAIISITKLLILPITVLVNGTQRSSIESTGKVKILK